MLVKKDDVIQPLRLRLLSGGQNSTEQFICSSVFIWQMYDVTINVYHRIGRCHDSTESSDNDGG